MSIQWVDSMRVMFRKDADVAVLAFKVLYPDVGVAVEVVRLCTSVTHLQRIVDVLSANLEQRKKRIDPTPVKPSATEPVR